MANHPAVIRIRSFAMNQRTHRPILLATVAAVLILASGLAISQQRLGTLNSNPYDPDSIANPYGAGSPYAANGINNPYSQYGSPYSNHSATNPYATQAPRLYDAQGNYRGRLSTNPYDPDSISNPYGRFGNPYSPDSINNPFGAGSPYQSDSPTNPYGSGWRIISDD
jgi:hypothetical protein